MASALEKASTQQELFENYYSERKAKYPGITRDDCLREIASLNDRGRMPNYFYYAVPEGMLTIDEIPPYAGLVYISEDGKIITTIRGPKLHDKKYTEVELGLCEKFYYNMRTAIRSAENLEKEYDYIKARLSEELASNGKDMTYSQLEKEYKEAVRLRDIYKRSAENYKGMYFGMVEGADLNSIERHLFIKEIKKYDSNFDYQRIIEEADLIYKERYPDRN